MSGVLGSGGPFSLRKILKISDIAPAGNRHPGDRGQAEAGPLFPYASAGLSPGIVTAPVAHLW